MVLGLLTAFFEEFYDGDIITEETFESWETSKECPDGKGVALSEVKDFLHWLKKAEEEPNEEETNTQTDISPSICLNTSSADGWTSVSTEERGFAPTPVDASKFKIKVLILDTIFSYFLLIKINNPDEFDSEPDRIDEPPLKSFRSCARS